MAIFAPHKADLPHFSRSDLVLHLTSHLYGWRSLVAIAIIIITFSPMGVIVCRPMDCRDLSSCGFCNLSLTHLIQNTIFCLFICLFYLFVCDWEWAPWIAEISWDSPTAISPRSGHNLLRSARNLKHNNLPQFGDTSEITLELGQSQLLTWGHSVLRNKCKRYKIPSITIWGYI